MTNWDSKFLLLAVMVTVGFVAVLAVLLLMVPKLTTVTGSDITAIVTALTTLVGTLVGTLFGYHVGDQGKNEIIRENEKYKCAISKLEPDCQKKLNLILFNG